MLRQVMSPLDDVDATTAKLRIWDGSGLNTACCQWDSSYKSMDGFIDVWQNKSETAGDSVRTGDRLQLLQEDDWVKVYAHAFTVVSSISRVSFWLPLQLRNVKAERVGTTIRVMYSPSTGSSYCHVPEFAQDVRLLLRSPLPQLPAHMFL